MNNKIVVTSGKRFTDLDALACAVAYREIPAGVEVTVVLPGPLNQSVSRQIRSWPLNIETTFKKDGYDYVIVDVSEKGQLATFLNIERIIEIYDHHFGFEKEWQYLNEKAKIEIVGACATLIWEEFKKRNPKKNLSSLSANLLYTAIISNTLNLLSPLTSERDKKALHEIKPFTDLPEDWISQYYLDLEREIYAKPEVVIKNDTKVQNIRGLTCAFCQLELWNSRDFLKEYSNLVESTLREFHTETWLFNSPCLSEGRNYLYTKSETLKNFLRSVMTITFEGNMGITNKLWLRKEILKLIQ